MALVDLYISLRTLSSKWRRLSSRSIKFIGDTFRYTKTLPSVSFSVNPNPRRDISRRRNDSVRSDKKARDSERRKVSPKRTKEKTSKKSDEKISKPETKESLESNHKTPSSKEVEVKQNENADKINVSIVETEEATQQKSPVKLKANNTPDKDEVKSPTKPSKSNEPFKLELKIERKKSPKRIEKPKVNIFLEDSDEVDEFESSAREVISKWSSPILLNEDKVPEIVPAPIVETKTNDPKIPEVVESPERSPVFPISHSANIFEPSSVTMEKSPTPSPPLKPTKVRNVCSFLSDIASGSMFSGLGLGSGMYDDRETSAGLNLDDYKVEQERELPEIKQLERSIKLDIESIMEPDTTAGKMLEKALAKSATTPSDASDSDESDSDTSSSSDSSDDTTSESEESSEESSDDDVPTFTRGFGRFDASSMPMVTQIKPTSVPATPTTQAAVVSRFQPQQSVIKPPGLATNLIRPFYAPNLAPNYVQTLPTATAPFTVGMGSLSFPIPFKIYSLRDNTNCEMVFPSPVQPVVAVTTPTADKSSSEKERKTERDRRDRERKRSRSQSHSRDRDKKRVKDDRKKSPTRRRSQSPNKKRSDDRGRQIEERKDSRRRDSSPRHSSHSSRVSYGSRLLKRHLKVFQVYPIIFVIF